MHATGTERQRAVIAAYRMAPKAPQAEIARAAGVSKPYVSTVLRDYLASRDQACQMPVGTTSKATEKDVATWAVDRRIGGNTGSAACSVKERAIRIALADNPRSEGEGKNKYCRRIAAVSGTSPSYVWQRLEAVRCEAIGDERRAKEAAEVKTELVPFTGNIGPVQHFTNWIDVFHKFQMTAVAYRLLAQSRGDVYATAFLDGIRETADKAATRAAMSKTG